MSNAERFVREEFDRWADAGRGEEMARGHGDVTAQALDLLAVQPNDRALDVGCGTGWAVAELRARGASFAVGTDLSPRMLRRAARDDRAAFVQASAGALPFCDASFTAILSVEALYYTKDLGKALREVRRVLAPGGRFVCVVDLYRESPACDAWVRELAVPVHVLSATEWTDALRDAGFENASHRFIRDRRGILSEAEFQPGPWFPDYESYRGFKELGGLVLMASDA